MSFPSFTCIQCTRLLLSRLAQSHKTPSHSHLRRITMPTTRKPPPTARRLKRVVGRVVISPDTFARARLARADVPPLEFWAAKARAPLVADLSAEECLRTAEAYTDAAEKDVSGWRERLISTAPESRGGRLSAYTLHYVAVIIVLSGVAPAIPLAVHIFHTLAGLDYAPSILTLARFALNRSMQDRPQFEVAFQGLERMIRRIGDGSNTSPMSNSNKVDFAADACTLRALLYAAEDTREGDNNALRWFRRAYEVGGASEPGIQGSSSTTTTTATTPEKQQGNEVSTNKDSDGFDASKFDPRWQWKASFMLGVAAIRMKRGELEKAMDMYTMASSELDNTLGYLGIANALEKMGQANTEKYAEALVKAALSGDPEAARKMGTREWDSVAEAGLGRWEKRKRQIIAEEWMGVAGAMVPAEA